MLGKVGNLIARLHLYPVAEIAGLELLCAYLQGAHGDDHLARQQSAGHECKQHAARKQPCGSKQQTVYGLQRLAARLLEKNETAEAWNGGPGRQHCLTIGIFAEERVALSLDRRCNLRQIGEARAQKTLRVRMGEQASIRAHDQGRIVLSDLRAVDEI